MKTPILKLQKALYERLSEFKVYDEAPDNTPCPYLTIGDDTSTEWNTKLKHGEQAYISIHAWSSYRGAKEVKQMIERIMELLSTPLKISEFEEGVMSVELIQVLHKELWHGIVRISIKYLEV